MKVFAVTRPKNSLERSREIVEKRGFKFIGAPTIELFPTNSEKLNKLKERIKKGNSDFIIFTSQNGVKFFFNRIDKINGFVSDLSEIRIVAIGPKTADELKKYSITPEIPEKYSSRGIVDYLSTEVNGKKVEIARSSHGSEALTKGLRENGANVQDTAIYEIGMPKDTKKINNLIKRLLEDEVDILSFTSQMTVKNFFNVIEDPQKKEEVVEKLNEIMVAAIGSPTKSKVNEFGVRDVVVPEDFTFENLVDKVADSI
ncbi:MAG: Uroporphyrinogen-III synthase HemD [Candidatus Methanohalarchaeum thermophilum]|uniref:Uroporphyrinogen-III synthase HemD n=1 Tax=Methanohalarchaeum thermophilum TaxID=1903181 RepID=A0A1Q6DS64_METT1|nr:MAG: Uroporphyrinogen-III synthase HemD [Candidatus Methanohalarchaeum thermophilum]